MGQDHSKSQLISQNQYFKQKKKEQLLFFTGLRGFLENTNEWVVLLREEIGKHSDKGWSRALISVIKTWESYQDSSSKVAFAWNRYGSLKKVPKVEIMNTCLWKDSIANLQTFSFEVESDPNKKALHGFLTIKQDCILYRIIKAFKKSLINCYCVRDSNKLRINPDIYPDIVGCSKEIDNAIIIFSGIILSVIPKFFLDLPEKIQDIESIVRNSIISEEVLDLLVLIRKEIQQDIQDRYLQALQGFGESHIDSPILQTLERDNNSSYVKAIENLVEITQASCIGEMHDAVAMLMNHISLSLFDPANPCRVLEDDYIIKAFLFIIGRSSAPDLPLYLDILNVFMDGKTLDIKDVGKGIMKLTFIVENVNEWKSFITN